MIEDHVVYLIIAFVSIPLVLGLIYAWITRPSKYYYRHDGYRWIRKR